MQSTDDPTCLTCGGRELERLLHLDDVPALCNAFLPTEAAARTAPRGTIDLVSCTRCGLMHNAAFDETLATYSTAYDNSLHYSAVFQDYADTLARRLIERYGIFGKPVVEIGCGSGNFLSSLCDLGGNRGLGYDPSYDTARDTERPASDVVILPHFFPTDGLRASLVVCRHVLEHVPDPRAMLESLRGSIGDASDTVVYFEVPDATYMLREVGIWDVIHEHVSYFTASTLSWLFESSGFEVLETGTAHHGQYLWIEARPASVNGIPQPTRTASSELLLNFTRRSTASIAMWRARLQTLDPASIAVWGAGSKGVMFLNVVDPSAGIRRVVDISPHKCGRHVPGTGQRVQNPDALRSDEPRHVVVMNAAYQDEIERALSERSVSAAVLTAL